MVTKLHYWPVCHIPGKSFEYAKDNDKKRAGHMFMLFQKLYAIENRAKEEELSPEDIKILRHDAAIPIFNDMELWMKKQIYPVPLQGAKGKTLSYTINLWPWLKR